MTLKDILVMFDVGSRTHEPDSQKWSLDRWASHPYTLKLMSASAADGEGHGRLFVYCPGPVVMSIESSSPGRVAPCDDCNRIDGLAAGYCHAPCFLLVVDTVPARHAGAQPHQVLRLVQPA